MLRPNSNGLNGCFVAIVLILLFLSGKNEASEEKKEDDLEGTWVLDRLKINGEEVTLVNGEGRTLYVTLSFSGRTVIAIDHDLGQTKTGRFSVRLAEGTRELDFDWNGEKPVKAVYTCRNGELSIWAFAANGARRPTRKDIQHRDGIRQEILRRDGKK